MHRCECGNCSVALVQNISECYCCKELEECRESLESDLVQQDFSPNASLTCVTEHPGFNPVCLQKWSLRLAASKFKTKGKQQYRQKGGEDYKAYNLRYIFYINIDGKPQARGEGEVTPRKIG